MVFDGRLVVARHQRVAARTGCSVQLDHYLEVLKSKPGALPGSTALAEARESGSFTSAHEAFWAASRRINGDADGTRELIEDCSIGAWIQPTLRQESSLPSAWERSAPTSSRSRPVGMPQLTRQVDVKTQRVVSLIQHRLMDPAAVVAGLPRDTRPPLPTVNAYAELLAKRSKQISEKGTASKENIS